MGPTGPCEPASILLAVLPSLVSVYVFCMIVGGGLLLISTVFGGGHSADLDGGAGLGMDVHADADVDVGATPHFDGDSAVGTTDGAGDAYAGGGLLALSSWFSIRFLVYFAATFGLLGTVLSYMTQTPPGTTFGIALIGGVALGQAVHQLLRALRRSSGGSAVRTEDFLNKPGRVTIAINPPARGEVAVQVRDQEHFLMARAARGDDRFNVGDQVVVTSYSGGTAAVVSRQEHEFLMKS